MISQDGIGARVDAKCSIVLGSPNRIDTFARLILEVPMLSSFAQRLGAAALLATVALTPMAGTAQTIAAPMSVAPPTPPTPAPAAPAASTAAAITERVASVGSDYHLGSGDKIRVIVFGEESLSGEFVVSGNGKVSLPLVGDINAADLTVPQFQAEVSTALQQGYLKEPRISVEVLSYRPFYILGEVNKPGEYPYSNGLTVLNAVATAGGFTYRAQTKKVFIRHGTDTAEQPYTISSQTPVAPGDTIRIGERFF